MNIRIRCYYSILLLAMSYPTLAAWETHQSDGVAQASYSGERYKLVIGCTRSSGLTLSLEDTFSRGDQFDGVQGLMMWLTLPDGRTDRWPVSVTRSGSVLKGQLATTDLSLGFFQNGQHFRLDSPITRAKFLRGDMVGTGAARLAFKQHCDL